MSLNDIFTAHRARTEPPPPALPAPRLAIAPIAPGDPRAKNWLTKAVAGKLDALAAETSGGRNHSLNAAAHYLGRFVPAWLDEHDTIEGLLGASARNGLLGEDGQAACLATIKSGLASGGREPRDPPVDADDGTGGLSSLVAPGELAVTRPGSSTAEGVAPPEQTLEERHQARVAYELEQLRARHDARQLHLGELAAANFRPPASTRTLADELALPEEPITFSIQDLLPTGGNALLTAAFKSGKTTLLANLLRAYADNEPFLGRFNVAPGPGRIAIFNYELSRNQFNRWLRDADIKHPENVSVLHLRGSRLPLTTPSVEDWVVAWLKDHDVSFWIADPFARAATGTDENSNTEVGVWLDTFDVIKGRAGVGEAVLATHTGRAEQEHGQERARGATRLDDWADVRWLLTKDNETGTRFLRATGRDVEMEEGKLTYEESTRGLVFGGGDRRWEAGREMQRKVLQFIVANPGCNSRELRSIKGKSADIDAAIASLIPQWIRKDKGTGASFNYYWTGRALA